MSNIEVIVFRWPLQVLLHYQGIIGNLLAAVHRFTLTAADNPPFARFKYHCEEKITKALNVYSQPSI